MTRAIVWFRQDLRLMDNPSFFAACTKHTQVIPLYILDPKNSVLGEAQAWWLHHSLNALLDSLSKKGLKLVLRKGNPVDILLQLVEDGAIDAVYWNRCYEPSVIERDKQLKAALQASGTEVMSFNGSLLHEPWTIYNKSGDFFKVFTPYWKTCRNALKTPPIRQLTKYPPPYIGSNEIKSEELTDWKLLPTRDWASQFPDVWTPGEASAEESLKEFISCHLEGYKVNRDFPAMNATSRLSPHLHFGEISPWQILRAVELYVEDPSCDLASAEHFLSELGWREFSYYLLYHVPTLPDKSFREAFNGFPWEKNDASLKCWQKGMTGYPIIDAGMRELWATGYMHNRVRMLVASFLTKGLLIDWRRGADWFLDTLVDADLANNSMGWQWVAGCGVDTAPYFRIFNPMLQSQKFDPAGVYIRCWVPELASLPDDSIHAPWKAANATEIYRKTQYPRPMIDHDKARSKALSYYKTLSNG